MTTEENLRQDSGSVKSDAGEKSVADHELMTVTDVCQLLRISSRTVYNLLKADKFPKPVRIGRSMRWSADEIRSFAGL